VSKGFPALKGVSSVILEKKYPMQRRLDGAYVTTDRPILPTLGLLAFAVALLAAAWHRYETYGSDWLFIGITVCFAVIAVGSLTLPVIQFSFDPARQTIEWNSRSLMKRDGGRLNFSDVRNVVLQSMADADHPTTYRVAICTDSKTLPMSCSYSGNRARVESLATAVRALLGMPADTLVSDSIAAMNASGKTIDAAAMQRDYSD
jgi:hypothetical protein